MQHTTVQEATFCREIEVVDGRPRAIGIYSESSPLVIPASEIPTNPARHPVCLVVRLRRPPQEGDKTKPERYQGLFIRVDHPKSERGRGHPIEILTRMPMIALFERGDGEFAFGCSAPFSIKEGGIYRLRIAYSQESDPQKQEASFFKPVRYAARVEGTMSVSIEG